VSVFLSFQYFWPRATSICTLKLCNTNAGKSESMCLVWEASVIGDVRTGSNHREDLRFCWAYWIVALRQKPYRPAENNGAAHSNHNGRVQISPLATRVCTGA